jgi:hypothetical protein
MPVLLSALELRPQNESALQLPNVLLARVQPPQGEYKGRQQQGKLQNYRL